MGYLEDKEMGVKMCLNTFGNIKSPYKKKNLRIHLKILCGHKVIVRKTDIFVPCVKKKSGVKSFSRDILFFFLHRPQKYCFFFEKLGEHTYNVEIYATIVGSEFLTSQNNFSNGRSICFHVPK